MVTGPRTERRLRMRVTGFPWRVPEARGVPPRAARIVAPRADLPEERRGSFGDRVVLAAEGAVLLGELLHHQRPVVATPAPGGDAPVKLVKRPFARGDE